MHIVIYDDGEQRSEALNDPDLKWEKLTSEVNPRARKGRDINPIALARQVEPSACHKSHRDLPPGWKTTKVTTKNSWYYVYSDGKQKTNSRNEAWRVWNQHNTPPTSSAPDSSLPTAASDAAAAEGGMDSEDDAEAGDAVCCKCGSGDATDRNDIVLCDGDGCGRAYHQLCLIPALTIVPAGVWLCPRCVSSDPQGAHRGEGPHLEPVEPPDPSRLFWKAGDYAISDAPLVESTAEVRAPLALSPTARVTARAKNGLHDRQPRPPPSFSPVACNFITTGARRRP